MRFTRKCVQMERESNVYITGLANKLSLMWPHGMGQSKGDPMSVSKRRASKHEVDLDLH